ncbi:MAG: hypothetical protein LBR68_05660, partial [Lachnoclostridium sp.]|nr:hypothetical protein [Lachnoclostridium sp.]
MAKMKIYEISRSLQSKNKEIKSSNLVKLLNENGFDVKGANSNIEDDAIAFLLKSFQNLDSEKETSKKTKKKADAEYSDTIVKKDTMEEKPVKTPQADQEVQKIQKDDISDTSTSSESDSPSSAEKTVTLTASSTKTAEEKTSKGTNDIPQERKPSNARDKSDSYSGNRDRNQSGDNRS